MQRMAALALCVLFWNPQAASATACEIIGNLIGGFAGGASGYGLVRSLGAAGSWVSAGLYGAGVAAASTIGDDAAEATCENFRRILETTASIYCMAGYYACDFVSDATRSLVRDFQICPSCMPDEVFGVFYMEDLARQRYLQRLQERRNLSWSNNLSVLPRNHIGSFSPSIVDAYFAGQQLSFSLQRSMKIDYIPR